MQHLRAGLVFIVRNGVSQTVNCSFARDITAAMLVVGNKSVSLLWELMKMMNYENSSRKILLY